MREDLGYAVKDVSDEEHKELAPDEVLEIFDRRYKDFNPHFSVPEVHFVQENGIQSVVTIVETGTGKKQIVNAGGNGRLDAVANAIQSATGIAYVGIRDKDGKEYFGAGVDHDIIRASISALVSAMNRELGSEI